MNLTALPSPTRRFAAPPLTRVLRRLAARIGDCFAAVDLTTTAPVHYLSIADASRPTFDPSADRRFTR